MFPYERTLCLRLSQELHLLCLCCCSSPEQQKNPQALLPSPPLKTSHPSKPCLDHPLLFRIQQEMGRVIPFVSNSCCKCWERSGETQQASRAELLQRLLDNRRAVPSLGNILGWGSGGKTGTPKNSFKKDSSS